MKRGAMCLLVFGLANILNAAELGLEGVSTSELKEIEQEIAKGNVPPNFSPSDKPKRGVAKLTNTDNPSFNHLSSANSAKASAAAAAAAAAATASQAPLRYVYNNQYYPSNPYLSYLQPQHHAAQIAAQYAFQQPGVTHYLQTPTQIQYVSSPSGISSVPTTGRYQTALNGKVSSISAANYPTTGSVTSGAAAATQYGAAATQYVSAPQQLLLTSPQSFIPQAYVSPSSLSQSLTQSLSQPTTSSSAQTSSSSATNTMANYQQSAQQYYYPQQPIVMLLVQPQPQPMALVYPNGQQSGHQMAYLLGQHPLLNLFGGHRFGYPFAPQTSPVTYLVPMAVSANSQQTADTTSTTSTDSNSKQSTSTQETSASTQFGLRTSKA